MKPLGSLGKSQQGFLLSIAEYIEEIGLRKSPTSEELGATELRLIAEMKERELLYLSEIEQNKNRINRKN